MSNAYKNIPAHPGIRKQIETGRYQGLKKIRGKQYSATFDSIRQAIHWKNTFDGVSAKEKVATSSTLGEVWARMQELHISSLEKTTQRIWARRWVHLSELADYPMEEITSTVINLWLVRQKKWFMSEEYLALGRGHAGRCNLDNELNLFTLIFNWYKKEDEFEEESKTLTSPIRSRHKAMSFLRDTPKKTEDKKIPVEAAFKFFSALKDLYRDLAMVQFFCAGRIGEIAGIQIENINLDEEFLTIKNCVVWTDTNKVFEYLKPFPKNKETRRVHLHPELRAIIERRLKSRKPGCNFLFHVDGRPLNYGTIQSNYRQAQRKTGIPYTGTHCLRHGMATLARRVGGGGLDSTMAMTGHKSIKLADHYSKIDADVQKETSLKILDHIQNLGLVERKAGVKETAKLEKVRSKKNNVIPIGRAKWAR